MKTKKTFHWMDHFDVIRIFAAILVSLLLVFVIIFFVSDQPLEAISKMVFGPLQSKRNFFNVINRAIPLIATGLALNISLRSGEFNIASDGSFYIGAVVASAIAIKLPLPAGASQLTYLLAAAILGGLINMFPVIIKRLTGIDVVILSMLLNSVFYYVGLYFVSTFLLLPGGSWGSEYFPAHTTFGKLIPGTNTSWTLPIIIAIIVFVVILMEKSSFGYKVRLTGKNPNFARNAGLGTGTVILGAQFIGGSIAGMGGALEMLGMNKRFTWNLPVSYVWDGLLVHMLANENPVFIPLTAFFIAYLRIGAEIMSRSNGIAPEVIAFLQGIVILLIASDKFLYPIKKRYEQKRALAQVQAEQGGV